MIVKVQRSISTNALAQQMLVYNRDRSVLYEAELSPEIEQMFRPGELKLYAQAKLKGTIIHIGNRVEPQEW